MREIDKIALASFLHDIGKFRQRAGKKVNDDLISQYSLQSNYSHIHAAHTAKAINEMEFNISQEIKKELIELAASHHLKELNENAKIIQIANLYAGKLDRKELKENENFIKTNLLTPFSYIELEEGKPSKNYYPIQKLEGEIKIIDKEEKENSQEKYEKLYDEFIREIKSQKLSFKNIEDFLILKSIFEKYTTFIPSSIYFTYPDVSLFDHSLATAAIAVAIKNGNSEDFSLIQGDFTSIQSFIFSKMGESNKFITKILRAKSLFVNVLTEVIALSIVKELNLTIFNIVMNAGGKFTILSHKLNDKDLEKIKKIKEKANKLFEKINYLQTKFVIAHIDFKKDKFKLGEFKDVFKEMALKFEEEKLKFNVPFNVFDGYIESLRNGKCELCGINPVKEQEFCEYCLKFKEIGENLVKAKYIKIDLDKWIEGFELVDKKPNELYFGFNEYPLKKVANYVPKFSGNEDLKKYEKLLDEKNEIDKIKKGKIKTFYHIAVDGVREENGEYKGRKYLAILKADVDNLGKIFINGFKENSTFSRTLYLSRMLDYFFTNELMDFVKGKNVYTVFAGGDDLFLIGHYEDIITTYNWIIKRFKEYTKNPNFHLSAAIRLFNPNVPVNLIAELAEEELEIAKRSGKDAVYIFDNVIKNNEFEKLVNKKVKEYEEILSLIKKEKSGVTFLYRIYQFIEMKEALEKKDIKLKEFLRNARWKALFRYLIAKNFEEKVRDKVGLLGEDIENLGKKMILPLNLVLYKNRTY